MSRTLSAILALCVFGLLSAQAQPAFDPANPPAPATPPTEAYQEYTGAFSHQKGPKTVFVFLVRPTDGGAWTNPKSFATLSAELDAASQFYYNISHRQTWFGPKVRSGKTIPRLVVTPVIDLPLGSSVYQDNPYAIATVAKGVVEGWGGEWTNNGTQDPDNFDRWVIMSNVKMITSTGLAYVGDKVSYGDNSLSSGVQLHEWGHNWGVVHANFWTSHTADPRSADGFHAEYADGADIMGGNAPHLNVLFKERLGFLERSRGEIVDISASGTRRLYAHTLADRRNSTALVRGLLLPVTGYDRGTVQAPNKRVFLGFRHTPGSGGALTRDSWDRNAVQLHADWTSTNAEDNSGSHLLDTTPRSLASDDRIDAALKIGRTYSEGANLNGTNILGGFHVTPIARGSTTINGTAHEWIDVDIQLGAPSPNPPVASFAQPVYAAAAGAPLALSVTASDPDGDALAFDWRFGDGGFSTDNSVSQNKTYAAAGLYLVETTVSDRKGRTAAARTWARIGTVPDLAPANPAATFAGLDYRYYEATFSALPNFANLIPKKSGTVSSPDLSVRDRDTNFALVFEGFLEVPATDLYRFVLTANDGARLTIGSTTVVTVDGTRSSALTSEGSASLQAGRHAFRLEYFQADGALSLGLQIDRLSTGPQSIATSAWTRTDWQSNTAPAVAIDLPAPGSEVLVNTDVLLRASASDANGIARVAFFGDGAYLGEDTTAPYERTWSKVSPGTRSVTAIAYDATGRWTQSAPLTFQVVTPPPRLSVGINFNQGGNAAYNLAQAETAGAVYPQAWWTNATGRTGTASALPDNTGTATAIGVTWSGTANSSYPLNTTLGATTTADGRLMSSMMDVRFDETVNPGATFTGIPWAEYDVYVYFDMRRDSWDDMAQRFSFTSPGGATLPDLYGKNSLSGADQIGDWPEYDTWVNYREATATSSSAPNDQLLGNYVVFRGAWGESFTVTANKLTSANQRRTINAVQIVERPATVARLRWLTSPPGLALTEGGPSASLLLAPTVAPTAPVTVTLAPDAQVSASPAQLTFTPANWQTPQAVTFAAVDDTAAEGAHTGGVSFAISAQGNYAGASLAALTVPVTDNDQATVSVAAVGAPAEAGPSAASFHVTRSGTPSFAAPLTLDFTLTGSTSATADYTVSGDGVSFTPATGNGTITLAAGRAQGFILVTPVNDTAAEGVETIVCTLQTGSGFVLGAASAAHSIRDNDVTDYFTQVFGSSGVAFDLNNRSVTLTPNGSGGYTAAIQTIQAFASGTTGFTTLAAGTPSGTTEAFVGDHGFYTYTLPATFPFFGGNQTTAYVCTNGYLTFGSGAYYGSTQLSNYLVSGRPRIAAFDTRLLGKGKVKIRRITDAGQQRTVFFWENVASQVDTARFNNAQAEIFDDGRIRLSWLACDPVATEMLTVGVASGVNGTMPSSPYTTSATPNPFYPSDLSAYPGTQNQAPAFGTAPVTTAVSGQPYTMSAAAADPENNALAFTAPVKPAWLTLTDHGNGTATLAGTPPAPGNYAITLRVSDGSAQADQAFTLAVAPAAANTAPSFTSMPQLAANSPGTYSTLLAASDPDGQPLTFSLVSGPAWLALTNHGNGTATLAGTVPDTLVSTFPVVVAVGDGMATTAQAFTLALNRAPVLRLDRPGDPTANIPAGQRLAIATTVSDDGGTPSLAWTQVSGPGVATFESPAADDTVVTFSASGTYVLRLTANDGAATSILDVTVGVGEVVSQGATPTRAWWKFDEATGTTTADATGSGNTGTLVNTPGRPAGKFGNALQFNGTNQRVDVANSSSLQITGNLTIAFWIKRDTVVAGDGGRRVISKKSAWNSAGGYELELGNGTSTFNVLAGGSNYAIAGGLGWTTNWHHVAAVISGTTCQVYFDGVAMTMTDGSVGALASDNTLLRLGATAASTPAGFFNGALDDVLIFNRVLTAAEITGLANAQLNLGPTVNAGPANSGLPGQPIALAGSASDDGQPASPGQVSTTWMKIAGPGGVVFGSVSSPATTATFDTPGTYTLRLTADDGAIATVSDVVVSVSENPGSGGFESWISTHPAAGSQTAPGDDPDGDGVPNLLEYAIGTLPGDAGSVSLPRSGVDGDRLTLTFTPAVVTGLRYYVEASGDLFDWLNRTDLTNLLTPGEAHTHTDAATLGASQRRFLRLRVELE